MITFGQLLRIAGIQRVLIRNGFDELLLGLPWFRPIRFLYYLLPWNWFRRPHAPRAQRILHVLEELGPIFVKFGQLLSTRRDLLPDDIAEELSKLQDRVPPFPGAVARRIVEEAFGHGVERVFRRFEEQPLASASIAQVHAAELLDGTEVVVKVVRPDIEKVIRRDLGLLLILSDLAERYWENGRRLKPTAVVEEYQRVILDELDLMREAANASQLRRNFKGEEKIYVPEIDWDLTRNNVMVMERIRGIPINDIAALKAAGIDMKTLAETGVELFFTQVFRDRYFHADMHPGNIFVQAATESHPLRIVPVDFGIMGTLSDFDQRYLADNFLAFLKRDYRRVAELHVESGWVPPETRVDEFEFAIRAVCEPMFERPLSEISFGHLLLRLFQTAQRFHMHILPQLVLLQKTLVNIEGVGRQLYPELDIWRTAKPAIEHWIGERVGLRSLSAKTRQNLPLWIERLPEIPGLVYDVLSKTSRGRLEVLGNTGEHRALRREIRRANRRSVLATVGAGLLIAGALLLGLDGEAPWMPGNTPVLSWVVGALGLGFIVVALND